jgi:hypothetical protein
MKSWSVARWLANKISVRSTEPADWLENAGCGIKQNFLLSRATFKNVTPYEILTMILDLEI